MPRRVFEVTVRVMDERFGPDHELHLKEYIVDDQLDVEAYGHVERQIRRMVFRLHDQLEPQPVRPRYDPPTDQSRVHGPMVHPDRRCNWECWG